MSKSLPMLVPVLAGLTLALGACSDKTQADAARTFNSASADVEHAAKTAGAAIDRATDKASADLKDAGRDVAHGTDRALDKAGAAIGDAADDTGNALDHAGRKVRDGARDATR